MSITANSCIYAIIRYTKYQNNLFNSIFSSILSKITRKQGSSVNASYKVQDAAWICRYAMEQRPAFWQMPDSAYFESKQLYNTIREYTGQINGSTTSCIVFGCFLCQARTRSGHKKPGFFLGFLHSSCWAKVFAME